jgi:hypothetical protein
VNGKNEPVVVITLRLTQTLVMNRGIGDVMRNMTLMQDGRMIVDYESNGLAWAGDVVGEWVLES